MDLRHAIKEHVYTSKELVDRLRSNEAEAITEVDLVVLRAQLYLLECEAGNLLKSKGQPQESESAEIT